MAQWTPLRCSNFEGSLLYSFNASSANYSLYVTDLCRIFHERLTRSEILQRASDTECRIDPSQDEGQFRILLDKIRTALEGQDGTNVTAIHCGGNNFRLSLIAPLPPPFESLEWIVEPSELAPEHLRSHLIDPLISTAAFHKRRIEDLIDQLHEKDHIISKLLDKMEASGIDLTAVFPGAAGVKASRKGGNRDAVAKQVKGLASFEEQRWMEQTHLKLMDEKSSEAQIGELILAKPSPSEQATVLPLSLQERFNRPRDNQADHASTSLDEASQREARQMNEIEPERQNAPMRQNPVPDPLYQSSNAVNKKDETTDDETTEDEDEEHGSPMGATATVAEPHKEDIPESSGTVPPMKKLGMIRGRKKITPEPAPVESPDPKLPLKRKSTLGVIVGKGREADVVSSSTPESLNETRAGAHEMPDEIKTTAPDTPKQSETDEQKAARRRIELKRSLETKSKAPQKKRRF